MRELFSLPSDYSTSLRLLLSKADGDVFIFDQSLRGAQLDQGVGFDELNFFFERSPLNHLFMVLRSDRWLLVESGRLLGLLKERSHQAHLRLAGKEGSRVEDCFAMSKNEVVRKMVSQAYSGAVFSSEDPEYSSYIMRKKEIWDDSELSISLRPLGL